MANSSVRLASGLPDGNKNGLASIAHLLVDDPSGVHVAIVLLDCSRLVTSVDDGSVLPTARIRAIEPIAEGPDAVELRRLLRRAVEKRTGATELPLELERALDELGVHPIEDRDPLAQPPDSPLPAPDPMAPSRDEPVAPADPLAPSPDMDAAAPDDELAPDDPRRGPLPPTGLFREPPASPADDEDDDR